MTEIRKKWQLESFLQENISQFEEPKIELEQYITPPTLASSILWDAFMRGDLEEKRTILDLGCGTGTFCTGCAAICGSSNVIIGIDIDPEVLDQVETLEDTVQLINMDVRSLSKMLHLHNFFDTVFLNPPFGTKRNKGIDIEFLRIACTICVNQENGVVYSLHKSSTRQHVLKKIRSWGWNAEVVGMKYDLPNTYGMHKKKNVEIKVDLFRISKQSTPSSRSNNLQQIKNKRRNQQQQGRNKKNRGRKGRGRGRKRRNY